MSFQDVELRQIRGLRNAGNSSFTVSLNGTSMSTATSEAALMEGFQSNNDSDCVVNSVVVSRTPNCGNDVCEIGEPISVEATPSEESCPEDCDFRFAYCAFSRGYNGELLPCSGHGICSFANEPSCDCHEGYTGETCGECVEGFYNVTEPLFRCLPRQNYVPSEDDTPDDTTSVDPTEVVEDGGSSSGRSDSSTTSLEKYCSFALLIRNDLCP